MNQHCGNLQNSAHGAVCCSVSSISTPVECEHNMLSPCYRQSQKTRRRSHRRYGSKSSSRQFLFVLCSIFVSTACLLKQSQAFSLSPSSIYQSRITNVPSGSTQRRRHGTSTRFYMSSVMEQPASPSSTSRMSDFQRRMKGIVKRNGVANGRKVVGTSRSAAEKPANLKVIHTLEEYKDQLDESSGKIVVVRFFATWCKVRIRLFANCYVLYFSVITVPLTL